MENRIPLTSGFEVLNSHRVACSKSLLPSLQSFSNDLLGQDFPCKSMPSDAAITSAGEPSVSIVLLNWNDTAPTLACLDALRELDYRNARILVVDNGSDAASLAPLVARQDIALVRNAANLGFAGGVNVGLRRAFAEGADYVWLLNNDALPAPDALKTLVAAAEADPDTGLLSPILHDHGEADKPNACFGLFDRRSLGTTQTDSPEQARHWLAEQPANVIAFGTALLIRRRLFERIGGFDESLFAYAEDVDYCLRCTAAGLRIGFCFDAIVWHSFRDPVGDPAACPPHIHYYMSRNYPLLWRKLRGPPLQFLRAGLWLLRRRLLLVEGMRTNPSGVDALLAGLWDGLRGRGGAYDPARRAPWWIRSTLGRHPRAFVRLMDRT
jgi:GT2 family glycosyltransferase